MILILLIFQGLGGESLGDGNGYGSQEEVQDPVEV